MIRRVEKYIRSRRLLSDSDKIVVGVSGGADSVVLLDILHRLRYQCIVCHCNFRLRGEESVRDELFVEKLALTYSLPYVKTDFETEQYAAEHKISVEMAARELRYRYFEEMRMKYNADVVAVAHHRDDSTETLLLNLCRGTGIRGLTGIRAQNEKVVRPLLCLSKEDILNYSNKRNLSYVTDSTNEESVYTRNFIRREIIPLFEKINPEFRSAVQRTIENLSGVNAFYMQTMEELKQKMHLHSNDKIKISIPEILLSVSPQTLLFEMLSLYGFNSSVVYAVYESLTGTSGKEFYSESHRLIKDRDFLILTENKNTTDDDCFMIDKNTESIDNPISLKLAVVANTPGFIVPKDKNTACFDVDKINFPLRLRRWEKGDWFIPFGMTGKKKISDYFSDKKYSLIDKENAWLLCSENQVIRIIGERSDNRFRVDEKTVNILMIKENHVQE